MNRYPKIEISKNGWLLGATLDTMQDAEGWDRLIKNGIRLCSLYLTIMSMTHILPGWWQVLNVIGMCVGMLFVGITRFDWLKNRNPEAEETFRIEVWR